METVSNLKDNINPLRISQWISDNMFLKSSNCIQTVLYSKNLSPEQLSAIYRAHFYELYACSAIRNVAEIYSDDDISTVRFASYDTEYFLNSFVKHTKRMLITNRAEFEINCDKSCKNAIFDFRKTTLIISNLVSNSIIHNKSAEKHIRISASMRGDDFVISVRDNGKGITPAKRKNLFSAYKNVMTLAMADKIGSGLTLSGMGLAVSRKTAQSMSGDVVYVPSSKYTEFELRIPQSTHRDKFFEPIAAEADKDYIEMLMAGIFITEEGL